MSQSAVASPEDAAIISSLTHSTIVHYTPSPFDPLSAQLTELANTQTDLLHSLNETHNAFSSGPQMQLAQLSPVFNLLPQYINKLNDCSNRLNNAKKRLTKLKERSQKLSQKSVDDAKSKAIKKADLAKRSQSIVSGPSI